MKHRQPQVIVIGGGHAGVEAAYAVARMGVRALLVTLNRADLGVMSCNPAIGGLGKGHLVREIDAMGGLMGVAADRSGIQFRLLNRRKGPAVQGPRTQSDRDLYRSAVQEMVQDQPNLTVVAGEVVALRFEGAAATGCDLADGTILNGDAVVLTTGTFLRGVIHIGDETLSGGRWGGASTVRLAEQITDLGVSFGRLKTGTPPRISSSSIAWDRIDHQPPDADPVMLSFRSPGPYARQVSCGITHTNATTHAIIQDNLASSAMYSGRIAGTGPRYCPSIEDKVTRFADKESHQIFLEPEGLTSDLVYPNGISTSLPRDVQTRYVRSIVGLETAEIVQPGYAIEYDYVSPQTLEATLQLKGIAGLFFAGQINGTTGYEEAAAQGLIAGLNAAATAIGTDRIVLTRSEAYIGVMIDDLVTLGVSEPYRMFTSRAEFRLALRADNADQRLTPRARDLGILSQDHVAMFDAKMARLAQGSAQMHAASVTPTQAAAAGVSINQDGKRRTAYELLGITGTTFDTVLAIWPELGTIDAETRAQIARDALYAPYIERQKNDIAALERDEAHTIPDEFRYEGLPGLSNELQAKLAHIRPRTLRQASHIEGMTPAALTLLLSKLKRDARARA